MRPTHLHRTWLRPRRSTTPVTALRRIESNETVDSAIESHGVAVDQLDWARRGRSVCHLNRTVEVSVDTLLCHPVRAQVVTKQVGPQVRPRSDGRHAAARNRFIGLLNFFGKSGETISTRTHSQIANVASLFWASACWIFWCQCGHGNMGSAYVSASDQKLRRQLCVWAITAQVAVLAQTTK